MVKCVHAMTGVDTFNQMDFTVIFGRTYKVSTCTVKSYRIKGGKNTNIAHLRVFRRRITVAIHRKVVGYTNVKNFVSAMISDCFCSLCH